MKFQALQRVNCPLSNLSKYKVFAPEVIKEITQEAKLLKGIRIVHLNATSVGGGVAEMLRSEVPLQKDIGLDSSWYIIPPNNNFFEITKKIHNLLQGKSGKLTADEKKTYIQYKKFIARSLLNLNPKPDILLVHDPQPAAAVSFLNGGRPKLALWRCHIDTSSPNKSVWQFLTPYLKFYDHFIFTSNEYIHGDFPPQNQVSFITPVIDPLSSKNKLISKDKARKYIKRFGIDLGKPLVTQVSRLDPWKDPLGVIDAYRLAKNKFPDLQLALLAQSASDDPEGKKLFIQVKNYIKEEKGIFLLLNLSDNEMAVNAFQTASDVIVQKSIREGFSLAVTEAMWKGSVVVAGNVGGIKLQIKDGLNGFLVNSPFEASCKILQVLRSPRLRKKIAKNAHESVKNQFLLPYATLSYLKLFKSLLKNNG